VLAAQRVLARTNWEKLAVDGRTADEVHPEAIADADLAFGNLRGQERRSIVVPAVPRSAGSPRSRPGRRG
jgi:hypothetical protein